MTILYVFLFIFLLFLSALFASAETAIFSLSQIKLRILLQENKKGSKSLKFLKDNPELTLITILIANNLVNISISAISTVVAVNLFGSTGVGIAIGVITFLILLLGEITPKSIALRHNEFISLFVSPIIYFLSVLFFHSQNYSKF